MVESILSLRENINSLNILLKENKKAEKNEVDKVFLYFISNFKMKEIRGANRIVIISSH